MIKSYKWKSEDNKNFILPYEAELESRNIVVVYDGHTSSLQENSMLFLKFYLFEN